MNLAGAPCATPYATRGLSFHLPLRLGVLSDPLHCIWTLPPGETDFGKRWATTRRAYMKNGLHYLLKA